MALKVKTVRVGMLGTNCYIIYREAEDGSNGHCVIVDPGAQPEKIIKECEALFVEPEAVLLTHGHFDHIMGVEGLRTHAWKHTDGFPVYALKEEALLLEDANYNLSCRFDTSITVAEVSYLRDKEELTLLGTGVQVMATPGHTIGGACYYMPELQAVFAGDTLFLESYGRTDLPTGDMSALVRSIAERLMALPDETDVYPGHEDMTSIGHERKYNICNVIYQRDLKQ